MSNPTRERGPDRSSPLLTRLVHELDVAPSGVSFITTCLDRVIEGWDLRDARAVIDDPGLGPQIFSAGRRPLGLDEKASAILARGTGIQTEPTLVDAAAELDAIAGLCEIALRLDRLHHQSLHDPLTGLYNRRGFDAHFDAAIARSVRYGWSFGLVLLDLDGFKTINDRLGHQHGDSVLREVGEHLRRGLRSGDIAARVGGDEFALLVHMDEPAPLDAILERLRGVDRFGESLDVGWTAGVAICPDDGGTAGDVYRAADERLYRAKTGGAGAVPVESVGGELEDDLDTAEPTLTPNVVVLTDVRERSANRKKTVKAAATAAVALALSGGVAAAATGNLPGRSHGARSKGADSSAIEAPAPDEDHPIARSRHTTPSTVTTPDAQGVDVVDLAGRVGLIGVQKGAATSAAARAGHGPPDASSSTESAASSDPAGVAKAVVVSGGAAEPGSEHAAPPASLGSGNAPSATPGNGAAPDNTAGNGSGRRP